MSLLEKLQASITAVAETLEITADEAAATAARLPSLLRVKPETIRGTLAALLRIPELELVALALCKKNPLLVSYRGDSLTEKWDSLGRATEQQPRWCHEFQELPRQLGEVFSTFEVALKHHQRLTYLTESQESNAVMAGDPKAMFTWLRIGAINFEEFCPDYKAWLKLKQSNLREIGAHLEFKAVLNI